MINLLRAPRALWLTLFLFFNIVAAIYISATYELMGDVQSVRIDSFDSILPVAVYVIASYILVLVVGFPIVEDHLRSARMNVFVKAPAGIVLIVLQLGFIAYVWATGLYVAGSTARGGDLVSYFWVLVPLDTLFLIYYAFYRQDRLFYPNLALILFSNLQRGWAGVFVSIAFMEMARQMRAGRMTWPRVGGIALVTAILFPLLLIVKWQVRLAPAGISLVDTALQALSGLDFNGYMTLVSEALVQLVGRWQLVSNAIFVDQSRPVITGMLESGQGLMMWHEGIYGIIWDRIFNPGEQPPNLGFLLVQVLDPLNSDVSWNANPSLVAWFVLFPAMIPLFVGYCLALMWVSLAIVRDLGGGQQAYDMVWFACLMFILPGWIAAYITFLHSLIVFWAFHHLCWYFSRRGSLPVRYASP